MKKCIIFSFPIPIVFSRLILQPLTTTNLKTATLIYNGNFYVHFLFTRRENAGKAVSSLLILLLLLAA